MVMVTTLLVPPALKRLLDRSAPPEMESAEEEDPVQDLVNEG